MTEPAQTQIADPVLLMLEETVEVLRVLGKGGSATVYEGILRSLGTRVAVKILDPSKLPTQTDFMRFRNEARFTGQLNHPNIVKVFSFGILDDTYPYLIMELLSGSSLQAVLNNRGPLDYKSIFAVMKGTSSALSYAHEIGIVHRDVKPANIVITSAGPDRAAEGEPIQPDEVKITDFGIAKIVAGETSEAQRLTQTGAILGTPLYLSPEQCISANITTRSDIYALGCVFYAMLTGRPPFLADSAFELIAKHAGEHPQPPSSLRKLEPRYAQLDQIILKMLAKNPDDRYQRIDDVISDIESMEKGTLTNIPAVSSSVSKKTLVTSSASSSAIKLVIPAALILIVAGIIYGAPLMTSKKVTVPTRSDLLAQARAVAQSDPVQAQSFYRRYINESAKQLGKRRFDAVPDFDPGKDVSALITAAEGCDQCAEIAGSPDTPRDWLPVACLLLDKRNKDWPITEEHASAFRHKLAKSFIKILNKQKRTAEDVELAALLQEIEGVREHRAKNYLASAHEFYRAIEIQYKNRDLIEAADYGGLKRRILSVCQSWSKHNAKKKRNPHGEDALIKMYEDYANSDDPISKTGLPSQYKFLF